MALLELNGLKKAFDAATPAVNGVSLKLKKGDILCLLGPSGCGKTTLLRMIAGLETPDSGRIIFEGREVTRLSPQKRNFGLMFQEFALFPHKNVFDNVAFGLEMQNLPRQELTARTEEMLELMGLADLGLRGVANLSGGERQRVALARSLAPRPRLLMLDEPLGSLDRALRERLLAEIRQILKTLGTTTIFVTHDQSEALAGADCVAVMNRGRLEQLSDPENLYLAPATKFTAAFLGFANILPGVLQAKGLVETRAGLFRPAKSGGSKGAKVHLVLRPEAARLVEPERAAGENLLCGRVVSRLFTGQSFRVCIALGQGPELVFDLPNSQPPPQIGQAISLTLDPKGMVVITDD